jgi:hypothetical protein
MMAYDRYETRDAPRDERSRSQDDRSDGRERGGRDDRGFFERAGDEVASWFGDDEAERRRREDQMREGRERGYGGQSRDSDRGDNRAQDRDRGFRDRGWERSGGRGYAASERDYNPNWRQEFRGSGDSSRGYRPMTGDYGRGRDHESGQFFAASSVGRGQRGIDDHSGDYERSERSGPRDEFRRTAYAGSADRSREDDPHYHSWRQRHMSDLDRDYDEYRRENQARFESDFGSWRERRQQKRALLGQIREHMEVVGSDDQHVGTVDRVAGDRIILTKSDPESGGVHHSLSCSDIDRVEGDRVVLDLPAEEARHRWRDESRDRALFEREDRGEMGPRNLDRSFEGTYR